MIIESETNKITVRLSKKDLEVYDIDFYNLNFKSKKSKELIEEWLFIAGINFDIYNNNFMVNTSSVNDEYIIEIILFYKDKLKKLKIVNRKKQKLCHTHIFFTYKKEDMQKLVKYINAKIPNLYYQVYILNKQYFILININYIFLKLKNILIEYTTALGFDKITSAVIKEHGKMACLNH